MEIGCHPPSIDQLKVEAQALGLWNPSPIPFWTIYYLLIMDHHRQLKLVLLQQYRWYCQCIYLIASMEYNAR